MPVLRAAVEKLIEKGPKGLLKALGRKVHYTLFQTPWNFELIPSLLSFLASHQKTLTIVQVGANVGNTESDPLCRFLLQTTKLPRSDSHPRLNAVLIEPVPSLFKELSLNYAGVPGIILENVAVAEIPGLKVFYSLKPGIDLKAHGLPAWSYQLGSFLPNQTESFLVLNPEEPTLRAFVEDNLVAERLPCETLTGICEKHGLSKIDFLQVDAEGYDFHVLASLDFNRFAPHYINYERIHLKSEESKCRRFLSNYGYVLRDHGQDTLAIRSDKFTLAKKLAERIYCFWLDIIF